MKCCSPFIHLEVMNESRLDCVIEKSTFQHKRFGNSGETPERSRTTQLGGGKIEGKKTKKKKYMVEK